MMNTETMAIAHGNTRKRLFLNMKEHMLLPENCAAWFGKAPDRVAPTARATVPTTRATVPTTTTRSAPSLREPLCPDSGTRLSGRATTPTERDSLFWCLYIAMEGAAAYHLARRTAFRTRAETLTKATLLLREKRGILKEHKLSLTALEAELMSSTSLSLRGLWGLCIAFETSVLYETDGCCYRFYYGSDSVSVIRRERRRCSVTQDVAQDERAELERGLFAIEDPAKPLGSISRYTLKTLQGMCEKLGLPLCAEDTRRLKRAELYAQLKARLPQN